MKADKEVLAPNICNMTKWSNHVTRWTVSEIVSVKDNVKSRAVIVERFIMLAQHLEKMNNFNGVKEILAGLQSSSVHRLKRTREVSLVPSHFMSVAYINIYIVTADFCDLRSWVSTVC
jgi:methionine synthase II (cobalamin-independent)